MQVLDLPYTLPFTPQAYHNILTLNADLCNLVQPYNGNHDATNKEVQVCDREDEGHLDNKICWVQVFDRWPNLNGYLYLYLCDFTHNPCNLCVSLPCGPRSGPIPYHGGGKEWCAAQEETHAWDKIYLGVARGVGSSSHESEIAQKLSPIQAKRLHTPPCNNRTMFVFIFAHQINLLDTSLEYLRAPPSHQ
jgi:hypothetical protein